VRVNTQIVLKRSGPAGWFSGIASTSEIDRQGDVVQPDAFDETLRQFASRGARIPLLWQHDQTQPIGAIVSAVALPEGLSVEGQIALESERGREAYALAKTGGLSLSIGCSVTRHRYDGDVRVIEAIDLHEISVVSVPANPGAVITNVKSLTPRDLERALRDRLGLSSRDAKRFMSGGYSALVDETPDPAETLAAEIQSISNFLRG
jgi:HK97 family phage prohead protease